MLGPRKVKTHLKDFLLRKECLQHTLLSQGCLGNCFSSFSHPGTHSPLQLWSKGDWLVHGRFWQYSFDAGSAHRQNKLRSHGDFHPDFKGKPGRPGNVYQGYREAL
jgi:hypothetical protein